MKNRFVLSIQKGTPDQEKEFAKLLESKGLSWWHWLPNTWLIVDFNGLHNKEHIMQIAMNSFPKLYFIAFQISALDATNWAGFGPTQTDDPKKDMFLWINTVWK